MSAWRPTLGTRFFLATALLVTATVAAAVAVTYFLGQRVADSAARATLDRSATAQANAQAQRLDVLPLATQLLAGDPSFAAYVAESLEGGDTLSLLDQLDERLGDIQSDFAMVLDPDGALAASTLTPAPTTEQLAADPLIRSLMEEYQGISLWARGDRLYNVVGAPVTAANLLLGFLIAGFEITELEALDLKRVGGADVTFFTMDDSGPQAIATSLDSDLVRGLTARLAEFGSWMSSAVGDAEPMAIELDGKSYLAQVRPMEDAGNATVATAVSVASSTDQIAPFARLSRILLGVGLGVILLSLIPSFLIPRQVLKPVHQLVGAARAATAGNYDQQVATGRTDEVGELANAFDTLLAELREKRDMERYLATLSSSLPEAPVGIPTGIVTAQTPTAPDHATRRTVAIMAVELRSPSVTANPGTPDENALQIQTAALRHAASGVQTQGGTIEAVAGRRLFASFAGEAAAATAIAAAIAIHDAGDPNARPAFALAAGDVLSGPIRWSPDLRHAATGVAIDEAERLLRVANPGDLLVAQSLFSALAAIYRMGGQRLHDDPDFSESLPVFALEPSVASSLVGGRDQATWRSDEEPTLTAAPSLTTLAPGHLLGNRFEIISTLGHGGMGVVYKANDRELQELVAVKMIRTDAGVNAEQLERLKQELKLARKISHANIVRTFDFGDLDGSPFITMEYIRGITLRRLLDTSGALPLSAGLHLARQLCRGLAVAHAEGVLHRDIKPENLIVEPSGNAKLMDFGIARPVRRTDAATTQEGAVIGTPFYLAPEQARGEEPDVRADIYACGVVFYEVFTGELPYLATGSPVDVIVRKLNEEPTPASEHWPGIPDPLETTIMRCLQREREKRYPDVASLLGDLEAIRA